MCGFAPSKSWHNLTNNIHFNSFAHYLSGQVVLNVIVGECVMKRGIGVKVGVNKN